jgi:hypothetical protein
MKIYTNYNDLPATAAYIGGTCPDGSMDESTADAIGDALDLACLHDDDGSRHYFDLAMETTKC